MTKELDEKFVSDDEYSTAADAVDGAGGKITKKRADVKKTVDASADEVAGERQNTADNKAKDSLVTKTIALPEDVVEVIVSEGVASIFEGTDLSEEFKQKAELVFSAAVHEAVAARLEEEVSRLTEEYTETLSEAVETAMTEITDSLDSYLDYVVKEWMEENELAIETGIRLEMADSLMSGLHDLFVEHNIDLDEEKIDIVSDLEEELQAVRLEANKAITESISLSEQVAELKAEQVFTEATRGLTVVQTERLRALSEKIGHDDLDVYAADLKTLRESFFKTTTKKDLLETVASESEADEILAEETTEKRTNIAPSVSAYVKDLAKLR